MAKKQQQKPLKKRLLQLVVTLSLLGVVSIIAFVGSIYLGYWGKIPTTKELTEIQQSKATEVWSADGKLLGKYYTTDRQPIPFESFPKHLLNALVATEDTRFYEHSGVDKLSLFRVLFKSVLMGNKSSGGGSTLSQQLAKNMFPRRNIGRFGIIVHKIREIIIANRLEATYSKEELITQYLNTVPFSDNTFGIESASLKFFNKSAYQLKLEEAAVLIGMLKTNYYFNPRLFPEKSKKRRNTVLAQMYKYDYISKKTLEETQKLPLEIDYQSFSHNTGLAPYFREYVKQKAKRWLEDYNQQYKTQLNLYNSGLKIYTTLNAAMQSKAEKAMEAHMSSLQKQFEKSYGKSASWLQPASLAVIKKSNIYKKLKKQGLSPEKIKATLNKKHEVEVFTWEGKKVLASTTADSLAYYSKFLNTGFVSLEAETGAVKSWIGGINFEHFKYDHVFQSQRQVGSTFKPIVYTAALENGYSACDYISNKTVSYKDLDNWTPTNASLDTTDHREFSLWAGLANSLNVISVKLIQQIGVNTTINLARSMGIETELPNVPSLALGTAEISVLELAKAYTSIANNGRYSTPFVITKIENNEGELLKQFEPIVASQPAFSTHTNRQIIKMMQRVTDSGTAKRLRYNYKLKNEIASKTGTTQSNKDGWYVGVTPKLVTVCWVGADNHKLGFKSTRIGQGANSALPIFANWYQSLTKDASFDNYTKARFKNLGAPIDCPAFKEPTFIKELFSRKDRIQKRKFDRQKRRKEKGGSFFRKLFGKKISNK